MADFMDRQAEESDDDGSVSGRSHSTGETPSEGEAEEPVQKKQKLEKRSKKNRDGEQKKKKKSKKGRKINSSDEDEEMDDEDEEEQAKKEMAGFIVDQEDDEGGEEDKESEKSGEKSDLDDLDEDDIDLIQENLDMRGEKRGRGARLDDSDEDDDRDAIGKEIFGYGDEDEPQSSKKDADRRERYSDDERSRSDSEGSHADDFIQYGEDERRPVRSRHKKGREHIPDGALDEARDVFGVEDFNFDEFYEDAEEEGEAEEDEMYDEDEFGDEERPRRRVRIKEKKATLLDTMEPTDLDRGYLAPQDKKIQLEDSPERFQLRRVPVTDAQDEVLEDEAKWIYLNAFQTRTISKTDDPQLPCLRVSEEDGRLRECSRLPPDREDREEIAKSRIIETLRFMRCSQFEVPFIAFYRKETVMEVLPLNELWKVYKWDMKWCHLQDRKRKLLSLMKRMQNYMADNDDIEGLPPIQDLDIFEVEQVQTLDALSDVSGQFHLFYGAELPRMQEWEGMRRREREAEERGEDEERDELPDLSTKFKQATRKDKYQLCVEHGIGGMASRFGLSAREFAENLDWKRHEVEQDPMEPTAAAEEYISTSFLNVENVIDGAIYMLAKQMSRQPIARQRVRDLYRKRVTLSVRPTAKGRECLDESHAIWKRRYITEKPISEVDAEDFLHYHLLKEQKMLEMKLVTDRRQDVDLKMTLLDMIHAEQPFHKDEYSDNTTAWNELRDRAVNMAIGEMIVPFLEAELYTKLLAEGKDWVAKKCAELMYAKLDVGPYRPPIESNNDDDDDERTNEVRVLGIVYNTDRKDVSFGALVDQDGAVTDTIRLAALNCGRHPNDLALKRKDMENLGRFCSKHRPHVIAIAGESIQARFIKNDIMDVVMGLYRDEKITRNIQVVIHPNDGAKVYEASKMALTEFPDYPPLLRQAVSLARFLLDPLIEYAHLYNPDEDIFCLSLHPLQNEISKEDLADAIQNELINRVNEVGVDVNKCLEFSHQANMLQFVCGLGPRKASHMMKVIRQASGILESRTRLVTLCKIGPKVFMNCSGFIKIDTTRVSDRTESYVEVLDGSRVHPETYEWARKMAIDALEVDDTADPTAALEEVIQTPDRLRDLDLDAFAEELARQNFGNKTITLYDIRSELYGRYKDLRREYREPSEEDLFGMLTNETKATLFEGKLVQGKVERVVFKKKMRDPGEQPQPLRDDRSDMWKCAECHKKYSAISEIFDHYESTDPAIACPGTPVGVRIRLDNGITGFIRNTMLSDNPDTFKNPAERVKLGQIVHARVTKVDPSRFSVDLTCRSSDLRKNADEWGERDQYWDFDAEKEDKHKDDEAHEKKKQHATQFLKRVIAHSSFHNVSYKDAERMLSKQDQGDAIIRPSSKSSNNLTVTWKVAENIYQHIDIQEFEKEKPFTLGKRLMIQTEEFDDLEEVLARWIQPMAGFARECLQHNKALEGYTSERKEELENYLMDEKRLNPSRIPYCFTPSSQYPGRFSINYFVRKLRQEYLNVTPEGIRFRHGVYSSLDHMVDWFKKHYHEGPPPQHSYRR